MVSVIRFDNVDDLRRFSELASQEDFNIYISTQMGMLDAKSLMGLFTILGKEVSVAAPDHANPDAFCEFLNKYSNTLK